MTWLHDFTKQKHFNLFSTVMLILLYLYFLSNHATLIRSGAISPALLIFIAMETIVVSLLLIRPHPTTRDTSHLGWLFAIAGTFCPLLLIPSDFEIQRAIGDALLVIGGLGAIGAYLSLNSSFGITPALRAVRTKGLYTVVRHPMYLSYIILYLGYLLVSFSLYNVVIILCMIVCMIMRIQYEEALLLKDVNYQAYRKQVKARLIPFLY